VGLGMRLGIFIAGNNTRHSFGYVMKKNCMRTPTICIVKKRECSWVKNTLIRPTESRGGTGDTSPGPHEAFIFMVLFLWFASSHCYFYPGIVWTQ